MPDKFKPLPPLERGEAAPHALVTLTVSPRSSLHRPSHTSASAPSPLSEYLVAKEPGRRERAENWRVAIGLQKVDGLRRIGSRKTGRWEFPPHPATTP